ncbi:tyrosine-type recombinase/integrase [Aestuariicoccus sp. MJ-SS9]|nr:tyrosine-type recombinase/integrase [Aestuariicoccus sp. MJ-SS9]MDU8912954.1 tyrosine-type recombinase/integrase [Aestuariicoccus sp. MJ-SS9]
MPETTIATLPDPSGFFSDPLTGVIREGARKLIEQAIEAELAALMAGFADDKLEDGRARFPSRFHASPHLSTRQHARLVRDWVSAIGLDPNAYGTHSLRRTKAALIYRKTGNLRAVQLLLGHTKVDSTVRYLGVELDDALSIAEKIEI